MTGHIKEKRVGSDLLSHRKVVPSALRGLTALFGMGKGDPPRFNHQHFFVVHLGAQLILFSLIAFNQCYNLLTIGK